MTGPVKKFGAGIVSCALWENNVTTRSEVRVCILGATVEWRCKDAAEVWKSSNSFSRNEISQAVYCLVRAYVAIAKEVSEEEASE